MSHFSHPTSQLCPSHFQQWKWCGAIIRSWAFHHCIDILHCRSYSHQVFCTTSFWFSPPKSLLSLTIHTLQLQRLRHKAEGMPKGTVAEHMKYSRTSPGVQRQQGKSELILGLPRALLQKLRSCATSHWQSLSTWAPCFWVGLQSHTPAKRTVDFFLSRFSSKSGNSFPKPFPFLSASSLNEAIASS